MAKRKKQENNEDVIIDLNEAQAQAQDFINKNQKAVLGIIGGLVLVIGGFFAYRAFIKMPKEKEAMNQLSQAQTYFEQDSFSRALSDPQSTFPGFLEIVENYGNTKAGNLANYYAGVSYLHQGRYKVAISYLKDFKPAGKITPAMKLGLLGDAYSEPSEVEDKAKALSYYKKAANAIGNEFTGPYYLMKAGMLAEHLGKTDEALKLYQSLKKKYPTSQQGQSADKYITRVSK